ncbi:MAG: tetratricopeptide repeat protein [Anaerolineae bacterium]|nr:tetratricopeptide repeat protein [Anaerolineae bacterium]
MPQEPAVWYRLGVALAEAGQKDEAMAAYQRAVELDPKLAPPWNGLGNVYSDLGQYEEAMAAYRRAIELDPKEAGFWNNLGNAYSDLGRHEEAIEAYRQAIELDPKDAYPWNGLGIVHALRGEWERAAGRPPPRPWNWSRRMARSPRFPCERGPRALGQEEEAQAELERARLRIEREDEYSRACFAALCGETEEALRLLEAALQKRPGLRLRARQDPDLRSLHGEPRFRELVGETGYEHRGPKPRPPAG